MVDVRDCGEYNSVAWESPESRQRAVKMYKWLQNNCNTSNLRSRLAHSSGVFLGGDWVRVWFNAVFPQNKRGQTFFPRPLNLWASENCLHCNEETIKVPWFSLVTNQTLCDYQELFQSLFHFRKGSSRSRIMEKKNLTMKNEIRTRQNKKMHLRFSGEIVPKFDIYIVEVLTWLQPRSYGLGMGTRLA